MSEYAPLYEGWPEAHLCGPSMPTDQDLAIVAEFAEFLRTHPKETTMPNTPAPDAHLEQRGDDRTLTITGVVREPVMVDGKSFDPKQMVAPIKAVRSHGRTRIQVVHIDVDLELTTIDGTKYEVRDGDLSIVRPDVTTKVVDGR